MKFQAIASLSYSSSLNTPLVSYKLFTICGVFGALVSVHYTIRLRRYFVGIWLIEPTFLIEPFIMHEKYEIRLDV